MINLLAHCLLAVAPVAQTTGNSVQTFSVDGVSRQAIVVRPSVASATTPVILAFHGHGGNMRYSARRYALERYWPEAVVIYPEGLPTKGMTDPQGRLNGWQQNAGEYGDRDIHFTDAMLRYARANFAVDNRRVYVMGHSNGGRFTYVLWSERPGDFAAYGAIAAPAALLARRFQPAPAYVVAGRADTIVPFIAQEKTIDALARLLGVTGTPPIVDGYFSFRAGTDGNDLETYVHPGGHEIPEPATAPMLDFFKRHPKRS